jgi:hypothetical protein
MYLAFAVSAPVVFAAEGGKHSKEERAKHKADLLKKYDKNGDGKFDKDEKAAAKAGQTKAKGQRKHSQKHHASN